MKKGGYSIYDIFFCCILFMGPNVMCLFGMSILSIYVIYLLIGFTLLLRPSSIARKNKIVMYIILFFLLVGSYKISTDKTEGAKSMSLIIMAPTILFGSFPSLKEDLQWRRFFRLMIYFFLLETCLAIVERVMMYNLLPTELESDIASSVDFETTTFRSTSLHKGPLENALLVTILMSFILVSTLNIKTKMLLWGLGFLSILCFNGRSSIVGNLLLMGLYLTREIFFSHKLSYKLKRKLVKITLLFVVVGTYLVFNFGLGGRLLGMGLVDDISAQTRIDVWQIFENFDINYFMWGRNYDEIETIFLYTGIDRTENFWIEWIMRYGVIYVSLAVLLYYFLARHLYKGYNLFDALFTSAAFLLIASTNNSLSVSWMPLFLYLFCICLFNPKYSLMSEQKIL